MCDDTSSGLHWQATLLVFGAVALPIALFSATTGAADVIPGLEAGVVIGGVVAGVFYFVTADGFLVSAVSDAAGIFKWAVCGLFGNL